MSYRQSVSEMMQSILDCTSSVAWCGFKGHLHVYPLMEGAYSIMLCSAVLELILFLIHHLLTLFKGTAKGVNRHNDILPNPKTRVVLDKLNGDASTSYMNANYIRGYDGSAKKYIASMG